MNTKTTMIYWLFALKGFTHKFHDKGDTFFSSTIVFIEFVICSALNHRIIIGKWFIEFTVLLQ